MSRVKSDLPEINIFHSSAERSEKTSKGISSSQIMKSGASLNDLKKIKSLRQNLEQKKMFNAKIKANATI